MPKEMIRYKCNICEKTYDDFDIANKCEQQHEVGVVINMLVNEMMELKSQKRAIQIKTDILPEPVILGKNIYPYQEGSPMIVKDENPDEKYLIIQIKYKE